MTVVHTYFYMIGNYTWAVFRSPFFWDVCCIVGPNPRSESSIPLLWTPQISQIRNYFWL